jgi:UDP-N-acetylglucosamine--N-acetylmuramyl-(pentapeptide) pyrophosphoryl-undecaprenol N-acetylglucosamine transferase
MPFPKRLVLAGGGTCGHIFPAKEVAREFIARHPDNRVLFINAGRELDRRDLSNWDWRAINVEGLKGRGLPHSLLSLSRLPEALIQSFKLLSEFSPDLVLGVGGYSSGPVVLAAHLMQIRCAIHEQNYLLGATNRYLCPFVDRIYLSFPSPLSTSASAKSILAGNPVRPEFYLPKSLSPSPFTVMIQGGSHGAPPINQLLIDSLPYLSSPNTLHFIHQTGQSQRHLVESAYRAHHVSAEVFDFIPNPAPLWQRSHLVVSRAGASSIAELSASATPSILIPLPARDNHQLSNARPLAHAGAAELLLQSAACGSILANRFSFYRAHPHRLDSMSNRIRTLFPTNCSRTIVDDLFRLYQLTAKDSSVTISQYDR